MDLRKEDFKQKNIFQGNTLFKVSPILYRIVNKAKRSYDKRMKEA